MNKYRSRGAVLISNHCKSSAEDCGGERENRRSEAVCRKPRKLGAMLRAL